MILRFGHCELDDSRVLLRRDGVDVRVEPQVFDLLQLLIARRGHVVRKEELLDEVWGSRFVSESALTTRMRAVRQAVGDDGTRQEIIRTVHGRGYEFVAPVAVLDGEAHANGESVHVSHPLPAAVEPLIGRDALLDRVAERLVSSRLVTLAGPGGVGKTRVAYELARRVAGRFEDGVFAIELVAVLDKRAAVTSIATAIGVGERLAGSLDDAVVDALRGRDSLLVLDNCEHLVEPVADLVNRILREAPPVSVVATSRERLAIPGEAVVVVEPLAFAGGDDDAESAASRPAVALFVERARAADPGFVLDGTTLPAVVEICRRLDGMPLAIELAAARVGVIDVPEIARRLDERFGLLRALRRGSDPRHRTLDDAIAWSYDLLTPDEQLLFTALSAFTSSFDLRAVEAIADVEDPIETLSRLTERSMLSVRRSGTGVGTRYEMLETLREYGRQRLDIRRRLAVYARHAELLRVVAREVAAELRSPREQRAMARAELSFADLRAAQRFLLDIGDVDAAYDLLASLREFAMRAMRYEVFAWVDTARQLAAGADHPLCPTLIGIAAYAAWIRGEYELAVELARESTELEQRLGLPPSGLAERVEANVFYVVESYELGHQSSLRQLEYAEESGEPSRIVHASYMAAVATSTRSEFEEARQYVARAAELAALTQSPTDLASVAVARGFVSADDEDVALASFDEADRLASSVGNRWMSAFARTEASGLLVNRGQLERGCAGLAAVVDVWHRAGEWSQQWHTLSRCVIALAQIGRPELAAEVIGAIEAHAALGVAPMSTVLRNVAFEIRDELADVLGADRNAELRARGAAAPIDDILLRTRQALVGRSPSQA